MYGQRFEPSALTCVTQSALSAVTRVVITLTQFLNSLVLMTQDVIPSTEQLLSPYRISLDFKS